MMINQPDFPAKVLLFGEYAVLAGSDACAFPLEEYQGRLVLAGKPENLPVPLRESNEQIILLLCTLLDPGRKKRASELLDLQALRMDIREGLAFESTIPQKYGVGSSGALVAAIYHAYKREGLSEEPSSVVKDLAFIESVFHEKSSGTDPLVSYLKKPVFIRGGEVKTQGPSFGEVRSAIDISLIDSRIPGLTKSGINSFQTEILNHPDRRALFREQYIPLVNTLTESLQNRRFDSLHMDLLNLTHLQLRLFPELFTPAMRQLASEGLDSGEFAVKLCGSGGGGFYLKISPPSL